MKTIKFNVLCLATYSSELDYPNELATDNETVLNYIRTHLADAPILDIEYFGELDNVRVAVTEEDLRGFY